MIMNQFMIIMVSSTFFVFSCCIKLYWLVLVSDMLMLGCNCSVQVLTGDWETDLMIIE